MNVLTVSILSLTLFYCIGAQEYQVPKKKCSVPVVAPVNIAKIINQCQDEIKETLLSEAAQFLESSESDDENTATKIRRKREVFSKDEKRIAGCLLQCVYRKRKAVNNSGFPTTEGLVSLYAEGVTDKDYLLATHQAVHYCLTSAHRKYIVSPQSLSEHGKTCDIAFDTFDCVSDKIGEYCGQSLTTPALTF